ncbi:MAG: hypothetical protein WC518_02515 [Patescibacteria group bacterium]
MKTTLATSEIRHARHELEEKLRQGGQVTMARGRRQWVGQLALDQPTCALVVRAGGPTFSSKGVEGGSFRCNQTGHIVKGTQTNTFRARICGGAICKPPPNTETSTNTSAHSSTTSNRSSSSSSIPTVEWTEGNAVYCPSCGRSKYVSGGGTVQCLGAGCYKKFNVVDRRPPPTVEADRSGNAECPKCYKANNIGGSRERIITCWYCGKEFIAIPPKIQPSEQLQTVHRNLSYNDALCPHCNRITVAVEDGLVDCTHCGKSFNADSNA